MAKPKMKPGIDADGEVRELTAEDLKHFRPAVEVLPAALRAKLGIRGPQKSPTKERITIRLSPEVVQSFRATGDGWQTRVDAALKDWLKAHEPAKA
jgi:uncharacterized protein (DUF4415 family)